jgi:Arc/MetJ-type ribon-helix-helix transcriptional regulator
MSPSHTLQVKLDDETKGLVDGLLASGRYDSAAHIIREGVLALAEADDSIERWLREDVARTYDEVMADPQGTTVSADDVAAMLAEARKKFG